VCDHAFDQLIAFDDAQSKVFAYLLRQSHHHHHIASLSSLLAINLHKKPIKDFIFICLINLCFVFVLFAEIPE
jgi:hypothetical protein